MKNNKELAPEYDRVRLSNKNVQETGNLVEGGQLNKLKKRSDKILSVFACSLHC